MNKEIVFKKDSIVIPCPDVVTIPRCEYNELIIAKAQINMILTTADKTGYGCAEIVKGAQSLDGYSKALAKAEERYDALAKEHDAVVAELEKELSMLKQELKTALAIKPEEGADA